MIWRPPGPITGALRRSIPGTRRSGNLCEIRQSRSPGSRGCTLRAMQWPVVVLLACALGVCAPGAVGPALRRLRSWSRASTSIRDLPPASSIRSRSRARVARLPAALAARTGPHRRSASGSRRPAGQGRVRVGLVGPLRAVSTGLRISAATALALALARRGRPPRARAQRRAFRRRWRRATRAAEAAVMPGRCSQRVACSSSCSGAAAGSRCGVSGSERARPLGAVCTTVVQTPPSARATCDVRL